MKKVFIYISLSLLLLALIIGITGYFFAKKYEAQITEAVLKELNQQIETKVDVKTINFSVFKNFPMASLELNNVYIKSTKDYLKSYPKQDTLIWAKKLSLDFNLFDISRGDYVLNQMRIKDAVVRLHVDNYSQDNFHFIKATKDDSPSNFSINLKKVILNQVDFSFDNTRLHNQFTLFADQFVLSGNLSEEEFGLSTSGSLKLKEVVMDDVNYLMYPNTSLNVDLLVNNSKVEVKKGSLKVGEEYLDLKGAFWFNNQSYLDIVASSSNMSIENIIRHLPEKQQKSFEKFDAKGNIAFELFIKGEASKTQTPDIEMNAKVNDAELTNMRNNITLQHLNFGAHYTSSSSTLEIKNFEGQLHESFVKGNCTIINFSKPLISADIDLESNLIELKQFFEFDAIKDLKGQLKAKVKLKGRLNSFQDISKNDIVSFKTSGHIELRNASVTFLELEQKSLQKINADLQLENNNILIHNLDFILGDSDAKFVGKAYNILAFSLLENEKINLNGQLNCDNLDMKDLLIQNPKQSNAEKEAFHYPKNMACRLKVAVKHFTYNKFKASDIALHFYMNEQMTQIGDFRMNTSQGSASGQLFLNPLANGEYKLAVNSTFNKIEMSQLLLEMDDFGQTAISHSNLHGKLYAKNQLKAILNSDLSFKKESLELITDFNIRNGELKNYKPLYSMSKFVELSELENIKFDRFQNQIQIKDSKIIIPKMDIQSSAIDLKMSGEHGFDNKYRYQMNVLLSEVLGNKAKQNKPENKEFSNIEDDGRGRTSIFLIIEGDGDDVKIKYDTKSVKEHIKEEFKEEKTNLKTILNEEFGLFKKDSAVIQKKSEKPKVKSTKENFQIEWEDD